MERLPVLISIPHGGNKIPAELKDRLAIGERDIFEDIDPFTQQIYDLGEKIKYVVKTDIARTFVDPSRSISDLPPDNPDGVIKSHTCFGKIIYRDNLQPNELETESLLNKYYYPYHHQLQEIIQNNENDLQICLDCHSMVDTGPAISPDVGKRRPMICLGNRFGESASGEIIQKLKSCFIVAFGLDETKVTINKPFGGGYITRNYGKKPLPWIQVEMNRSFYLREPYFNSAVLTISNEIIEDLNNKFYLALKKFFS